MLPDIRAFADHFLMVLPNINNGVWREVLELHTIMVAERPHEATWGRAEAVAMKFCDGDNVPFRRSRLPVVRRQRDPLWPRQGIAGAQESLLLEVHQPWMMGANHQG